MEGPFISLARKGAWNAAHLRTPDAAELRELIAASQGRIRRVNVAPELPGALEFIRAAREAGLAVSLGHSNATYAEALAGVDAGASITNHTFNAMSPLDHRAPGGRRQDLPVLRVVPHRPRRASPAPLPQRPQPG